jgi:hypothetical protein
MIKGNKVIHVQNIEISISNLNDDDYISLTDMAKAKEGDARAADVIKNWIRTRTALEFIGVWEQMNNINFKVVEFDHFKMQSGLPSFVLSPSQVIEQTNAIGMYVKSGRYGGTYAHKDIAFEFGSAISAVFKLYLIKEYQRLKNEENNRFSLNWSLQRTLAKVNYRIHTDAIKEKIIPPALTREQAAIIYASEADMLNVALFGKTAQQWKDDNPDLEGNVRDHATLEQLVVLSNMESVNSVLIHQGMSQNARIVQLNKTAIIQLKSLLGSKELKKLQNPLGDKKQNTIL